MFPGFANIYKDSFGFVHLYFFNGIDENGEAIFKNIDLTNSPFTYSCTKYDGNSAFDYKFDNKSIVKIKCQLVEKKTNKISTKILSI